MKTVLCIGDSLGMPRPNVSFQSCWFYGLSRKFSANYIFVNMFKRALTTQSIISVDFLENYSPQIVIMQIGIVDCAPRLYKSESLMLKIMNRMPGVIKNNFWKLSKRYKKRSSKNADVSLNEFQRNLINFCSRCEKLEIEKCIFIKIQMPGKIMVSKNPEIMASISAYNSCFDLLKEKYAFVEVVDPLAAADDCDYIEDGYHLNATGLRKVYDLLEPFFSSKT